MGGASSSRSTIMRWEVLFVFVLIGFSEPKVTDSDAGENNKFRQREASDDTLAYPNLDEEALANTQCPQHVELRWQTEVSSSVYATPLIADINGDGRLEVVVPTYIHTLEVLDGSDGEKYPGWPVTHQSTVHSSPLIYDVGNDGFMDIALATYNGEVLFYRSSGRLMEEKLVVPRRRVRKNWFAGLERDHADRSHPDVHDDSLIVESVNRASTIEKKKLSEPSTKNGTLKSNGFPDNDNALANPIISDPQLKNNGSSPLETRNPVPDNDTVTSETVVNTNETGMSQKVDLDGTSSGQMMGVSNNLDVKIDTVVNDNEPLENVLEVGASSLIRSPGVVANTTKGSQRRLLDVTDSVDQGKKEQMDSNGKTPSVENDGGTLEDAAIASFDVFRDEEENMEEGLTEEYQYDYDDYVDESMWGEEDWKEIEHEKEEDYIDIDAHILCTPVIADIDQDGVDEMIVAVSYFFDQEYYDNPENAAELGHVELGNYVACGIVVFDLNTKQVKWNTLLDLSTDDGPYRAHIYSSPTVVDLDNDGNLDIIVGTSFGFFYVLNHHGQTRENFPLQMGDIQSQILAADINDDGKIEMVTTDTRGNVAAWTSQGKEIWEVHLKSLIAQGPTAGDVDGDGHTDIVIPTISGNIYVLKGLDGSHLNPFPFRTHGRVMAPVLLLDLNKPGADRKGLTLVAPSFDGYLYLIDGSTACADAIDIGEISYSMVVADNVDGGDDLELIVTTMNGNVLCFSTPVPGHPLKAWPSQTQGRNVMSVRYNREGIFVLPTSRTYRDEAGKSFWLHFSIVDQYRIPSGFQGPYNVTATVLIPANYEGPKRVMKNQTFEKPGIYQFELPCSPVRSSAMVFLEMVDKNGLYFVDQFALSFHIQYYRLLKWLLILPMLGMFGIILMLLPQDGAALPSFSRDTHQL